MELGDLEWAGGELQVADMERVMGGKGGNGWKGRSG